MSEVTLILEEIAEGNAKAAERLLPLVYEELRKLASSRMAQERPGNTLQPTALVHEAWLRLGGDDQPEWKNRSHFFSAAAEAMPGSAKSRTGQAPLFHGNELQRSRHRPRHRHPHRQTMVDLHPRLVVGGTQPPQVEHVVSG